MTLGTDIGTSAPKEPTRWPCSPSRCLALSGRLRAARVSGPRAPPMSRASERVGMGQWPCRGGINDLGGYRGDRPCQPQDVVSEAQDLSLLRTVTLVARQGSLEHLLQV